MKAYRVISRTSADIDQFDDYCGSTLHVYFQIFEVAKWTAQGIWIKKFMSPDKFVLLTACKKYASPSKAEAISSFIARKTRYISILTARAHEAKQSINRAKGLR